MTTRVEITAAPEDAGVRLDTLLARQEGIGSRAAAQRLIEAGAVQVDGAGALKARRVLPGQRIVASIDEQHEPAAPGGPAPEVVFADEHLLVVDKPAGLVVHPARGHRGVTLVELLAGRLGGGADPERPGVVHRLDRDTSGLLVLARSQEAHAPLQRLIRRREMRREYLTLVVGAPEADRGTIDAPIGRDRAKRTVVSTRSDRPRTAVTHFSVLERLPGTTLMEVQLETGRTHQIRAHLAAIGHPVCGDARYGGGECGRALGLERQFLHSSRLMFMHPIRGEQVTCESKPPADLRRSLDAARQEPVSEGPDGD